jgi:hypothetical protein
MKPGDDAGDDAGGGYEGTTEQVTSDTPNNNGDNVEAKTGPTVPNQGNGADNTDDEDENEEDTDEGVDVGTDVDATVAGTPFVLAKQAMQPFLNHYRDGRREWDEPSVLEHANVLARQFKVGKARLREWASGQMKLLKSLRAQTTKPIEMPKAPPEHASQARAAAKSKGPTPEEAAALLQQATEALAPFITQCEQRDTTPEEVLTRAATPR